MHFIFTTYLCPTHCAHFQGFIKVMTKVLSMGVKCKTLSFLKTSKPGHLVLSLSLRGYTACSLHTLKIVATICFIAVWPTSYVVTVKETLWA